MLETLEFNSEIDFEAWYELNKDRVAIKEVQRPANTFPFKAPSYLPWGKRLTTPPIVVHFISFPKDP